MIDTEQLIELYGTAPLNFLDIVTQKMAERDSIRSFTSNAGAGGLLFAIDGSAELTIDDEVYMIERGTVLHVGPNLALQSQITSDRPFEYAVIHFRLANNASSQFPLFYKHFFIKAYESMKLIKKVQQLQQNFLIPGGLAYLQSKGLFLKILEEIIITHEKSGKDSTEDLDDIIDYMHQFYDEGISVLDIAQHFKTDRRKLSTLFINQIGVSPTVYITDLRIQRAKLLLRTSDLAITEVAENVGYRDHFYFSRVFKKETGFSPTGYRKYMK
ncbi:AraC family transcriptional regulator [Sporosarcina sp.]|uniref:AraC family transcriptional regulator n=1 Tax=Sporosarcina sp. TaxID=49982 RepID=UPI002624BE0F|nr:AraC family transcriptional regulator [Sporosarcina sp.]